MTAQSIHDLAGEMLRYPERGFHESLRQCLAAAAAADQGVAESVANLIALTSGAAVEALQEIYTRTFDLDPTCTMDVGWHLYGEAYQRGEFLAETRAMLRRADIQEHDELPDHLSHVVALLGRLPAEEAASFAARVLPAVDKLLAGLGGQQNPFEHAVRAVHTLITTRHAPEVCRG